MKKKSPITDALRKIVGKIESGKIDPKQVSPRLQKLIDNLPEESSDSEEV